MSESRVPENGMHGLIGGRWGQLATTLEIQRSTKVTTLRWATVSRQVVNRSTSGLPHRRGPIGLAPGKQAADMAVATRPVEVAMVVDRHMPGDAEHPAVE